MLQLAHGHLVVYWKRQQEFKAVLLLGQRRELRRDSPLELAAGKIGTCP